MKTNRSSIGLYLDCPRLRWLSDYAQGTGLQPVSRSLPLVDGTIGHLGTALLLSGKPIEDVVQEVRAEYHKVLAEAPIQDEEMGSWLEEEQGCLLEGLLRAWALHRLPLLLQDFEVVSVEEEFEWPLGPGVEIQSRFDALLRRKDDKALVVFDTKFSKRASDGWMLQWEHAPEWLCYTLAARTKYGPEVIGVQVEGLVKGERRRETAQKSPFVGRKIQASPLCYGVKSPDGTLHTDLDLLKRKGWQKVAAWQELSPKRWFEEVVRPGGLEDFFIACPLISPTDRELQRWREQTVNQEVQVAMHVEDLMAFPQMLPCYFPMNGGRCFRYGADYACPFEPLCYNEQIEGDPIGSGLYEPRQRHHQEMKEAA